MNKKQAEFNTITVDNFWDCNCDTNYIHNKTQKSCPVCNAVHNEDDFADSRLYEVAEYLLEISPELEDEFHQLRNDDKDFSNLYNENELLEWIIDHNDILDKQTLRTTNQ